MCLVASWRILEFHKNAFLRSSIVLKRIAVAELRIGMYIHEFCGSWMDHPFWKGRFLLDNERDLQRVLDSDVHEVWIDVSKGRDVAPGQASQSVAEVEAETEAQLLRRDAGSLAENGAFALCAGGNRTPLTRPCPTRGMTARASALRPAIRSIRFTPDPFPHSETHHVRNGLLRAAAVQQGRLGP